MVKGACPLFTLNTYIFKKYKTYFFIQREQKRKPNNAKQTNLYSTGLLRRLNEIILDKHLTQCLMVNKGPPNVSTLFFLSIAFVPPPLPCPFLCSSPPALLPNYPLNKHAVVFTAPSIYQLLAQSGEATPPHFPAAHCILSSWSL